MALLSGGALVQLVNIMATLKPSRRSMDSLSLGNEVAALEKTISVLQANFERENERHQREVESLQAEIAGLRAEVDRLRNNR